MKHEPYPIGIVRHGQAHLLPILFIMVWNVGCSEQPAPRPPEDVADVTTVDVKVLEFPIPDPCLWETPVFPATLKSEDLSVDVSPDGTVEILGKRASTTVDLAVETTTGVTLILHDSALNQDELCDADYRQRYVAYLSLEKHAPTIQVKSLGAAVGSKYGWLPIVEQANEWGDLVFAGRDNSSKWLDVIRGGTEEHRVPLSPYVNALSPVAWQESNERELVWLAGVNDLKDTILNGTVLFDLVANTSVGDIIGLFHLQLKEPCTPSLRCQLDIERTPTSMLVTMFPWVTYDGHLGRWVRRTKIGIINGALSDGPVPTSRFHHLEGAGEYQLATSRAGGTLIYTEIEGLAYAASASRNGNGGPVAVIVRKAENQVVLLGDNGHLLPSTAGVIAKVAGEPQAVSPKWPGVVVNVVDDGTDHQRVILWWPGRWPHSPGADRGACGDSTVCNDNDVCTADWCDDAVGCRHTPTGPTPCRVADSPQCTNHLNYPSLHKGWGNCPK